MGLATPKIMQLIIDISYVVALEDPRKAEDGRLGCRIREGLECRRKQRVLFCLKREVS